MTVLGFDVPPKKLHGTGCHESPQSAAIRKWAGGKEKS